MSFATFLILNGDNNVSCSVIALCVTLIETILCFCKVITVKYNFNFLNSRVERFEYPTCSDNEEKPDDEDDENDEDNWRNDYPDEDDGTTYE